MSIKIVEKITKNNPAYRAGRTIKATGGMLHSVGCAQPDPKVFINMWSKSTAPTAVHAVVGKKSEVYQLLPWNRRAWHCGKGSKGSGNDNLISLEMTEPATIKYTGGGTWIETGNGANTKAHVLATYDNAVEFFAYICKKKGISPDKIISHHEGNVKGIASNHGDVEHIWRKFGLTMNKFRKDVKKAMTNGKVTKREVDVSSEDTSKQKINPLDGKVTIRFGDGKGVNIRTAPSILEKYVKCVKTSGTFVVVGISKDEKWYKLKDGTFITAIPDYVVFKATAEQKKKTVGTGYYTVAKKYKEGQIGAFKSKDNAIELCKQNTGYKVFDKSGTQIYPNVKATKKFKVTVENLRIRKGPGTGYDYHKKDGKAIYVSKGTVGIVEVKDGNGAEAWGLIKKYEDKRDGWIALDKEYGKFV